MRQNSRLSRLLHVLLHMAESDGPLTSDAIARMLRSNPAVIRRIMAGLRNAGYVRSEKGHGGGWTLARPLSDMTLLDIHAALGEPELFAVGLADPEPKCLVEQAVNAAVSGALQEAEEALLTRFGEVRLSDIADDFRARYATAKGQPGAECGSGAQSPAE